MDRIDELIEKCRLTDEEITFYHQQTNRIAKDNSTEGNFKQEDINAIYDDNERAMLEAQVRRAITIIEAERESVCAYCKGEPDGAMLAMGKSMAHARCVIKKLNELLDPDYEGEGEPSEIVGFLSRFEPVELEPLMEEEFAEAQREYIKRTYNQAKIVLDLPLQGWRRDECLIQATIAKNQRKGQLYRKSG